jgi:hypothetical protein
MPRLLSGLVIPTKEAVRKSAGAPQISRFVVPAKAGTQGFQSLAPCSCQGQALGPRFRGGDDCGEGCRFNYSLEGRDLLLS